MLLARGFSYADAHRARLGVNYKQIPVNSPMVPVHSYSKDGVMRVVNVSDPVYAPNSKGGPRADSEYVRPVGWYADGDMVRSAYTLHEQDDDWGQPGTLVREVWTTRSVPPRHPSWGPPGSPGAGAREWPGRFR